MLSTLRLIVWTKPETSVANSQHFIAGPAEQESGADWRAVDLHPLKPSAFHGAL
jgi:hypothetical protein